MWTLLFPELKHLPRPGRWTALLQAAPPVRRRPIRGWRRWWRRANWILWPAVLIGPWARRDPLRWALGLAVYLGVWWAWPQISLALRLIGERRVVRLRLRRVLAELGHPLCVECGYDLRAARGRRCPECGRLLPLMRFEALVRAADRATTWWVTALSATHARDLLDGQLPAGGRIERVRQIVDAPADDCGEVRPVA